MGPLALLPPLDSAAKNGDVDYLRPKTWLSRLIQIILDYFFNSTCNKVKKLWEAAQVEQLRITNIKDQRIIVDARKLKELHANQRVRVLFLDKVSQHVGLAHTEEIQRLVTLQQETPEEQLQKHIKSDDDGPALTAEMLDVEPPPPLETPLLSVGALLPESEALARLLKLDPDFDPAPSPGRRFGTFVGLTTIHTVSKFEGLHNYLTTPPRGLEAVMAKQRPFLCGWMTLGDKPAHRKEYDTTVLFLQDAVQDREQTLCDPRLVVEIERSLRRMTGTALTPVNRVRAAKDDFVQSCVFQDHPVGDHHDPQLLSEVARKYGFGLKIVDINTYQTAYHIGANDVLPKAEIAARFIARSQRLVDDVMSLPFTAEDSPYKLLVDSLVASYAIDEQAAQIYVATHYLKRGTFQLTEAGAKRLIRIALREQR
jgi:hypothetical protein